MIMSLEEARAILGKDGEGLSDEQIEKLVSDLDAIARTFIRAVRRGAIAIPLQANRQKKLTKQDIQKVGEYLEVLAEIDRDTRLRAS